MKITPIVIAFLLIPVPARAECLTVTGIPALEVMSYQFSARHVRIIARRDGQILSRVKLFSLRTGKPPRFLAFTDAYGVAALPKLFPGGYHISAESADGERLELLLYVSSHAVDDTTSITLNFFVNSPSQSPPGSVPLDSGSYFGAQEVPVSEHLQGFKGVVKDPVGSFVAGATVRVFAKGETKHAAIVELRTDERGRFSALLPDGTYIALIQSAGFRTWFLTFKISKNGESKELEPFLILGSYC